ncbi:MAG: hypothetical protein U5O39_04520 [Gammaproteobacteria bacterium]|nr:hypothetical protein [Gammaproteobacteria bacterium]
MAASAPALKSSTENDITGAPVNPNTPFEAADNSDLVENDFNDASYNGARFGASYLINEDWDVLVRRAQQALETEGVFAYDPNLAGESKVNRFAPDENNDDFGLTTWTFNGRIAMLDVVYTGGFLKRDVDTAIDYTGYTQGGGYQVYYLCQATYYNGRAFGNFGDGVAGDPNSVPVVGSCLDPDKIYQERTDSERITHEFRISTPSDNRWRVTAGLFYDTQETETVSAFELASTPDVDSNGNVLGGHIQGTTFPIPQTGAFPPRGQVGNNVPGANAGGERFGPKISFVNDFTRRRQMSGPYSGNSSSI